MESQSSYTRQMLLQYGKQLIAARRLARYEQLTGRRHSTPDYEAALARRRRIVERISREIIENLIFTGSENHIVTAVKKALNQESGKEYIFRYPPGEDNFLILQKMENDDEIELSSDEKQKLMGVLWNVSLRVVDATML